MELLEVVINWLVLTCGLSTNSEKWLELNALSGSALGSKVELSLVLTCSFSWFSVNREKLIGLFFDLLIKLLAKYQARVHLLGK